MTGCCNPVEDVAQVLEFSTKGLANGLVTKADTQDGLLAGISLDDIEQESCL